MIVLWTLVLGSVMSQGPLRSTRSQVWTPSLAPLSSFSLDSDWQYHETQAVYFAQLTAISYCEPRRILSWNCTPCQQFFERDRVVIETVFQDHQDNFQGFVGYDPHHEWIVIAFRGSMDVQNWLDNLKFFVRHLVILGYLNI